MVAGFFIVGSTELRSQAKRGGLSFGAEVRHWVNGFWLNVAGRERRQLAFFKGEVHDASTGQ